MLECKPGQKIIGYKKSYEVKRAEYFASLTKLIKGQETDSYMDRDQRNKYWEEIGKVLGRWLITSPECLEAILRRDFFNNLDLPTYGLLPRFSAAEIALFNRCAQQLGGKG